MIRLFLIASLLCLSFLNAAQDHRKRYAANTQQKIIYTNKQLRIKPPATDDQTAYGTYFGLEGHYATGTQTDRRQLSKNLYRENDEAMIYNEVTFKLGFGDIGEDRAELGLTINKGYKFKDSTVESEFDTGRSIDFSYFFIFRSMYEAVDTTNIIPFVRLGAGVGQFDIKSEYQEYYDGARTILSTEYKYGAGIFSQLSRRMELSFCYLIIKREFQKIDNNDFPQEIIHNTGGLSLGLNYHF